MTALARNAFLVNFAGLMLLLPAAASASFDGFVLSIRHTSDSTGDIHNGSAPGQLVRYNLKSGAVVDNKVLYRDTIGITEARLGPFGKRIAFCRADGTLGLIGVDGGPITELGRFIPENKVRKNEPASTGLQWPASDGGRWLYYTSHDNELRRVDLNDRAHQTVVRFNRDASGEFALSPDATPGSGYFIKRTDNYAVIIYDLAKGNGDLYDVPVWSPGCGIGISPDGTMFAANDGTHTVCNLVDTHAQRRHSFRINQWDGDPTRDVKERAKLGWAWQHFRWSTNAMEWIAVKQARLVGASTHEIRYSDAMLYNWVQQRQINVTGNKPGTFDRPCGAWMNTAEQLLGYYRGEAPYTVEIADPRLGKAQWNWKFLDGKDIGSGSTLRHTFNDPGVFTLVAGHGTESFRAQVTVEPRQAPAATVRLVDRQRLLVDFDEPVAGNGSVQPVNAATIQRTELSVTGRQLLVTLARPLEADTQIRLSGYTDRAQQPNPIDPSPLEVVVPPWPTDHDAAIYRWESARSNNIIYDPGRDAVVASRLGGNFDREAWLRLTGGQAGTGFFSQSGAGMDFHQAVAANRFTMEIVLQPGQQSQPAAPGGFPRRIINCSAWHDGDWNFMLGQLDDRIVASIRTADNFLGMDGKPTRDSLHGRAPIVDLFTLNDTSPRHVVVTYEPGHLQAYVDGQRVFETDQVTGNFKWGYGELVFGGNHNSGRQRWQGRLRNIALYARTLPPAEVLANYAALRDAIRPLPRITVRARVLATSTIPTAASIAPYTEALVVNEYKVLQVTQRDDRWGDSPKIDANDVIRVYQWGLIDKKNTASAGLKIDDVRELTLEAYRNHPGKLNEVVTSDNLDLTVDRPLFYEPQ